jgi:hypothetical protein
VSGKLLSQVLGQSEHIQALIRQSAEELSSVNTGIEHALANSGPLPGVKTALDNNEAIIRQLQDASEKLTTVNQALQIEIRDRKSVV